MRDPDVCNMRVHGPREREEGCAGAAQLLPPRRVPGDLGRVLPERRGRGAVDEGEAAPVVAGVLQAVEEEGMRGALAGEGGAAGCTHRCS